MSNNPLDNVPDFELLRLSLQGNEQAFLTLTRRYKTMIYQVAYSYVKNAHDAEDVCQEILIKLLDKGHQLNNSTSFKFWLYRMVVNTSLNHLRSLKHSPLTDADATLPEPHSEQTPDRDLEQFQMAKKMQKCLEKLPEKQHQAIVLRLHEGLNFDEIAELTGSSLSTVKTNVSIAVRKLAECMEDPNAQ